jgi:D-alanine--poly(phosphoribitol) ligase subunit 1
MLTKLKEIFQKFPDRNALFVKEKFYTYSQLAQKINAIRKQIDQQSIPHNELLGIVTSDDFETYASFLAAWFSGFGFVPINPKNPFDRNNNILEQTHIKYVLSVRQDITNIIDLDKVKVIYTLELHDESTSLKHPFLSGKQVMCILFTSGSTGIPKGVPMTLTNINATLDSFWALGYHLNENDGFLQMFEFTFDMSMLSYLPAFLLGACVYSVADAKVKYLSALKLMQHHDITFAAMVPSTIAFLKPYFNQIKLENLKYSVLGGEPLYADLAAEWANCTPNAQIVNISGPTETTMACMGYNLHRDRSENRSYNGVLAFGSPWKNTRAIVVDENNVVVNTHIEGELCFAGDNVMDGYWNLPEKNKEVFFTMNFNGTDYRFYKTGDMAYVDDDGIFITCGRKDQQVKIQGHKVELAEIEVLTREYTQLTNVRAITKKSLQGRNEIYVFVEGYTGNSAQISQYLKSKVPSYMMPKDVIILSHFPVNINGKIDRLSLLEKIDKNE